MIKKQFDTEHLLGKVVNAPRIEALQLLRVGWIPFNWMYCPKPVKNKK